MNPQNTSPSAARTQFSWLCALSPTFLLLVAITMALHIRLGFGYWPEQAVSNFPALHFRVHDWLFIAAALFAVFAPIHLLVTLIHRRQLGVCARLLAILAVVYATGWVAFFVAVSSLPAKYVTWFMD